MESVGGKLLKENGVRKVKVVHQEHRKEMRTCRSKATLCWSLSGFKPLDEHGVRQVSLFARNTERRCGHADQKRPSAEYRLVLNHSMSME
jgi:hypothetical protein